VGALTEKLPAKKTVPLLETSVEGTCARCSVGCGLEYRWHGSLFTRVTERYEPPNNGKLCRKGKFGHEFLNDPVPAAVDHARARAALKKMLGRAKRPVMRISPYLCGEAIDAFLEAAVRGGIPVVAAGLERLDPGWAQFASARDAGCVDGERPLIVLLGDIAASNNVAFTEAWRRQQKGAAVLWVVGHDDETARRVASRVIADPSTGLREAVASGSAVEIWVNPEESGNGALDPLLAMRGQARINLLWNSRNAGYLLTRQSAAPKEPDLLLDIGVEEPANGTKRIAWGKKQGDEALFIPLSQELWILGRSHPTAMPSVAGGAIDTSALEAAAALLA
jgi:hypothetical protein